VFEHRLSPMQMAGRDRPSVPIVREARDHAPAQRNFRLAHRRDRRNIAPMRFARQILLAAITLAWLAGAAHAGPAGCELNKVAPARVATKDPRVYFVAGANARASACPSAASACRLRAYVMPGDEVLVDPTDGPYLCAFFKSQGGTETRGWLPRASLELVPAAPAPARQWDGNWQRDREAQIVIKSRGDEVEVSGSAMWGSYDPERVRRGGVSRRRNQWRRPAARSDARHRLTTRIDPPFRRRRIKHPTPVPRSSISTAATSWSRTIAASAVST